MVLAHFSSTIFNGVGPQMSQGYCFPRWSHVCLNFRPFPKCHIFSASCNSLLLLVIFFLRGNFLSHFSPIFSHFGAS